MIVAINIGWWLMSHVKQFVVNSLEQWRWLVDNKMKMFYLTSIRRAWDDGNMGNRIKVKRRRLVKIYKKGEFRRWKKACWVHMAGLGWTLFKWHVKEQLGKWHLKAFKQNYRWVWFSMMVVSSFYSAVLGLFRRKLRCHLVFVTRVVKPFCSNMDMNSTWVSVLL